MKKLARKMLTSTGRITAALFMLFVIAVVISHLLTPVFNRHLPDFETWTSKTFNTPVKIAHVYLSWSGYEPALTFEEVNILDKVTHQPKISIHRIKCTFDLFHSLFSSRLFLKKLSIFGINLTIHEEAAGKFNIGELYGISINDSLTGASIKTNDLAAWIFSQPKLSLHEVSIHYISMKNISQDVSLDDLAFRNDNNHHTIDGQIIFQQALPTKVQFKINWQGDVNDLPHAVGSVYFYVEGVSLPQWAKQQSWRHWQITQGIGSAKIWGEWKENTLQDVQSEFQLYNLALQSLITHKTQSIPRLSAHIDWKRDGVNQIITGSDVLINLSNHLWPTIDFSLTLSPTKENLLTAKTIEISYLDLPDTKDWLLISGLLPQNFNELLNNLNPQGEIKNLKIDLPVDTDINWENTTVVAKLNNIKINAWKAYPGIENLSGHLNWNAKQGSFNFKSQNLIIHFDKFYEKALQFKYATGALELTKTPGGLLVLNANSLHLNNEDIDAKTDFTMQFSASSNVLPTVDLKANFTVAKVENITSYLPLRIFDIDLTHWIKQAFHGGQIVSGVAELKGNLDNFPFDHNNGKFLITTTAKNVKFSFAPNWPITHDVNGELSFVGGTMIADADSGFIEKIPFSKVHAELTNIGRIDPSIVSVKGIFSSDLANGLSFLNHSPLQKVIGRNLVGVTLTGPMELKLGLNIPAAHPIDTKVSGDLSISKAKLSIDVWSLALEKIQGLLHFTEKSITADKLQGKLLGENVNLAIITQTVSGKPSLIKANLKSKIKISALQDWLKMPLSKVVQGETPYSMELDFASQEKTGATTLTIQSNLKGIAVNAPSPYGKAANVTRDFKVELFVQPPQPLQGKVHYGELLSAAISSERADQKLQLFSGEIHLGSGEANWQSARGFIMTGEMDEFDWDTWKKYLDSLVVNKLGQTTGDQSIADSNWLPTINVFIERLHILNQTFNQIRIQVSKTNNAWQIGLDNPTMLGKITLPFSGLSSGIEAKFQRLYFSADNSSNQQKLDPRIIPPIYFEGDDVRYGDKHFGHVTLNIIPTSQGVAIKELSLELPSLKASVAGSWKLVGGQQQTHLYGDMHTNQLNDFLTAWGFGSSTLVGSDGDLELDLSWHDAPYRPTVAGLSGDLAINLGKGRVTDLSESSSAKLGIGRMLSILNLQTIPRRLSLDFSDLVEKGYSFDYMKGDLSLKNGNAYTKNLHLDGPVARIDISGRIGLQAKDYDLTMVVKPYLTSSIPVVATIAGGPVAGVAAWLVDKVVSKEVSKVTAYHYKVEGPWDKPTWDQVKTESE